MDDGPPRVPSSPCNVLDRSLPSPSEFAFLTRMRDRRASGVLCAVSPAAWDPP